MVPLQKPKHETLFIYFKNQIQYGSADNYLFYHISSMNNNTARQQI